MIKTKMTLVGKVFMCLFFISLGFGAGVMVAKNGEVFNNSGVSTEITIEKSKGGDIIIDTESNQDQEEKTDKKFLGIF